MNIAIGLAVVLLATCEPSLADSCGVAESIENLVRISFDESVTLNAGMQNVINSTGLCYMGMGMKFRFIPDSAITASFYYGRQHEPYQARLDNQIVSGTSIGAWAAKHNVVGEWLQVDLGTVKEVAGVITQGRAYNEHHHQWVRSYKVSCGLDQHSRAFVQENGHIKVFSGNHDMETKVYNRFPEVMSCRFIRIYPLTWYTHITMRVEFVPGACFDHPHPY